MTEVTWGVLAKAVADLTKISEEIDADILTHNEDPSSHSQANEALYNHKIAAILDHLDESIKNIKINYLSRTFTAIVDAAGNADYTTIQAAVDYVNGKGGGRILVRAGTYTLSADITLYSNIEIVGEDADSVILDFNSTAYTMKAVGTAGTHKTNIVLRNLQIKNSKNVGTGALRLEYVDNFLVEDCYFLDNYSAGGAYERDLIIDDCTNGFVRKTRFIAGYMAIDMVDSDNIHIKENYFEDHLNGAINFETSDFLEIGENVFVDISVGIITSATASEGVIIIGNRATQCASSGIALDEPSRAVISNNILIADAGSGDGIVIGSGSRIVITGNLIRNFGDNGMEIADSDYCTITANICTACTDHGIKITDIGSSKNIVVANNLVGNDAGGFEDNGANTEAAHNIIA